MLHKVENRQKIKTSQEKAFNTVLNCREWPKFVPGCQQVEVLEESENRIVRRMHSHIQDRVVKMVTECEIDRKQFTMKFKQLESAWPIKTNGGEWIVKKIDKDYVEIILTHRFTVKYSLFGDLLAVLFIKKDFIYDHNVIVLQSYAKRLENG
jgi:ribosome-associated toxin RatA of RatAB toxin-antitoxin module